MEKFKAKCWIEKRHKMYDVLQIMIKEDGTSCLIKNDGKTAEEELYDELYDFWVIGVEPLLYTGRNDMNGKEIYEGDILFNSFFGDYWIVAYEKGSFILKLNNSKHFEYLSYVTGFKGSAFKKVGTIYENPELLKW